MARTTARMIDLIENGLIDPEFDVCFQIILALQILPKDFFAGVEELSTSPRVRGLDADTVEEIANGRLIPSLGTVIAMARALQVGPTRLCEGMIVEAEEG